MIPFRFLLVALMAFLSVSCEGEPEPRFDAPDRVAPALWKAVSDDPAKPGAAYLFGTMHTLPKDVAWRTPVVRRAMAASDRLVIEVLGLDDRAAAAKVFARLAVSPDQPPIGQRVPPSLRDELDAAIDAGAVPEHALDRMESWAAALSLASSRSTTLGLSRDEGVEAKLMAAFAKAGKPITEFETIEEQLSYFDRLPERQQRAMLSTVVREAQGSEDAFAELFAAWVGGDTDRLAAIAQDGFLDDPATRQALLVARNADWTRQIDAMLEASGTAFIGVGAAHLAGDDSVQEMLAERGYRITRVQ